VDMAYFQLTDDAYRCRIAELEMSSLAPTSFI
jgi:hypothetical protein